MKKTASLIIGLLFIMCAMTPVWAEDTVHLVKKGDTLWAITNHYLSSPWKWPIVWSNNQDITNPHLIFPGDNVIISRKGGKTTITIVPVKQAGASAEPAIYTPNEAASVKEKNFVISPQFSTYIYSPNILTGSGTILKKQGIGDLASKNETVLIKSSSGLTLSKGITIVTKVADVKDKDEVVGYLYKAVAVALVEEAQGDVYKATVAYSNQEIRSGDLIFDDLKPLQPLKVKLFEPTLKESARVIDLFGGVSGSSYLDLTFINVGKADGVDQGALLSFYKELDLDEEKTSMREYEGMAVVLQSLDNSCLALVIESKGPIQRDFIAVGVQ